jgi:O-antigen/teichoic acid export membrane protein
MDPEARSPRVPALSRSALLAVAPKLATVAVALGLSPYIVSKVGLAGFGFWSILQALILYAQVADGGLPLVATRQIAGALEAADAVRARQVAVLTSGVMMAISPVIALAGFAAILLVPDGTAAELPAGWEGCAKFSVAAFLLTFVARSFAAAVQGGHRWDLDAAVTITTQLVTAGATVVALELDAGLPGLGLAAAVAAVASLVLYGIAAHRTLAFALAGSMPPRALWRELRRQGAHLQVVSIVAITNAQADKLLLLPFAPLSWIGAYSLGARVATSVRALPVAALGPVLAHLSAIEARDGAAGIGAAYRQVSRAVGGLGFPGLTLVYCCMFPAVLAWLGPSNHIAATAALVLGLGYAFNILTGPGTTAAIAAGRAQLDSTYSVLGLVINLVLTPIFGLIAGPWGVVAATATGLVLSSLWLIRSVDGWLDVSTFRTAVNANPVGLAASFIVGTMIVGVAASSGWQSRELLAGFAFIGGAAGITPIILGFRARQAHISASRRPTVA